MQYSILGLFFGGTDPNLYACHAPMSNKLWWEIFGTK
jgi:hypothetical protein